MLQVRDARGRFGRLKNVDLLGFQHKNYFIFPSDPVARGALILCCQGFEEVLVRNLTSCPRSSEIGAHAASRAAPPQARRASPTSL